MLSSLLIMAMFQGAGAPVVINEFSYDDSGTDDREFVELYNSTKAAIDISGWKLDSADQVGPNKAFTIPANTKIAAGGFYVMGSALVPNVNQVVGTTDIWENSQESLTLRDAQGKIVDTLVYEANKLIKTNTWYTKPEALREGEGVWGNFASIDKHETSMSRYRDGVDTGDNRDFQLMPSTPGKSNTITKVALLFDNYDSGIVDQPNPDFAGSWDDAYYCDPTKTGIHNKNTIPASPQGGNAMIFWDQSGGGNANVLLRRTIKDVVVECWVYFNAVPTPAATATVPVENETWSIGVQGTTGTYYNTPDPAGLLGGTASPWTSNGNTGVSVTFQNITDHTAKTHSAWLYLIDHGNGGGDWKILGKVQLFNKTQGSNVKNDGWQRLRLEVAGDYASVRFGGSYGGADGVALGGRISDPREGGIYFGYREYVSNNLGARPLTIDRITVRPSSIPATNFGKATPTTKGTPDLGVNTLAMLGTKSFALTGSGLVNGGASIYALGSTKISAGVSPPFPAGTTLYTVPLFVFTAANSATGTSSLPLPIPTSSSLSGAITYWQLFDLDAALKVGMPFGSSGGLEVRLGF